MDISLMAGEAEKPAFSAYDYRLYQLRASNVRCIADPDTITDSSKNILCYAILNDTQSHEPSRGLSLIDKSKIAS